jgi:hypothetical protein
MIQMDTHNPEEISTLGDLRDFLKRNGGLPDDTPIQVLGDSGGDDMPLISVAKRSWRKGENGCMVEHLPDGTKRQVDQFVIVIKEWTP